MLGSQWSIILGYRRLSVKSCAEEKLNVRRVKGRRTTGKWLVIPRTVSKLQSEPRKGVEDQIIRFQKSII